MPVAFILEMVLLSVDLSLSNCVLVMTLNNIDKNFIYV